MQRLLCYMSRFRTHNAGMLYKNHIPGQHYAGFVWFSRTSWFKVKAECLWLCFRLMWTVDCLIFCQSWPEKKSFSEHEGNCVLKKKERQKLTLLTRNTTDLFHQRKREKLLNLTTRFVDETFFFTESFFTLQIKLSDISLVVLALPEVSTQHYLSG